MDLRKNCVNALKDQVYNLVQSLQLDELNSNNRCTENVCAHTFGILLYSAAQNVRVEAFRNDSSKHIPRDCNRGVSRLISKPATLGFSGRPGSPLCSCSSSRRDIRGMNLFFLSLSLSHSPPIPSLHFYGFQTHRSMRGYSYAYICIVRVLFFASLLTVRLQVFDFSAGYLSIFEWIYNLIAFVQ